MYEEIYQNNFISLNRNDIRVFLGYDLDYPLYKIVDDIIIYLRKSRKDEELYTNEPEEETLKRHLKTMQEWAISVFGVEIPEQNIFKEVKSGETIEARNAIKQVFKLIEGDKYRAIACVDVQRLGRGDIEDQGRLMKILRFSNTRVLTPSERYDLNNEYDRTAFKNKLRQSEEFLEYIKNVLSNGRARSVKDGNYPHSVAPYGYFRVKLKDRKGFTLQQNQEEATVSKLTASILFHGLHLNYTIQEDDTISKIAKIFGLSIKKIQADNLDKTIIPGETLLIDISTPGTTIISNYLNYLGIKPRKKDKWTANMVKNILIQLESHGFVCWGRRKTVTILQNGQFIKTRPLNKDSLIITKGDWEPIFNENESKMIGEILKERSYTPNDNKENSSLVGLVKCGYCGSNMFKKKTSPKQLNKVRKVRTFQVDKIKLQKMLRDAKEKEKLSINDIAYQLHLTRDVVAHYFSAKIETLTIPTPVIWPQLKELLKISDNSLDESIMTFQKEKSNVIEASLICRNKHCDCVGSDLALVETRIIEGLKVMLNDYIYFIEEYDKVTKKEEIEILNIVDLIQKELDSANNQLEKIYAAYENNIYSDKDFIERKVIAEKRIKDLKTRKKELTCKDNKTKEFEQKKKAIPIISNVLENYNKSLTPQEKNKLLKTIIKKIIYTKDQGGKNHVNDFTLKIILQDLTIN